VSVFVYEENGKVNASADKKDVPEEVVSETVKLTFRYPGHKDSVNIMKGTSLSVTGDETASLDFITMQDKIVRTLLVDWDLKDENGERVLMSTENLDQLNSAIVRAAVTKALEEISI